MTLPAPKTDFTAVSPSPLSLLNFGAKLDVAALTDSTNQGIEDVKENQDNFVLVDAEGRCVWLESEREISATHLAWSSGHVRVAVLDGLGGHARPREVAEAIARAIAMLPPMSSVAELSAAMESLHGDIQRQFRDHDPNYGAPAATVVMLEIPRYGDAILFHAGDSRLMAVDGDEPEPVPLTIDHKQPTELLMAGRMSEAQWRAEIYSDSDRGVSQAIGLGNSLADFEVLHPDLFALTDTNLPQFLHGLGDRRTIALKPGTVYLLATDGLWCTRHAKPWLAKWPALLCNPARQLSRLLGDVFDEMWLNPPRELHLDNATAVAIRLRPAALPDEHTFVPCANSGAPRDQL